MREGYIAIETICAAHQVELAFIRELASYDLITIFEEQYLPLDSLQNLEKMIVFRKEMNINTEGIDAILHLLNQIDTLNERVRLLEGRLSRFE